MRHVYELLVPGFGSPVLCLGRMPWARGMAAYEISWLSARPMLVVDYLIDLLMIDVPDLVLVSVVAPIPNSDHSSLSAVI